MHAPRTRILSDLHYRDPGSTAQSPAALNPLLRETERLVLNGDTLDTVVPSLRQHWDELRNHFKNTCAETTFISGNHDPDISEVAELSLADDRIWVTHGDVFFDSIAPWSRQRIEIDRRLAVLREGRDASTLASVETRLHLNRVACLDLRDPEEFFQPGLLAQSRRLARTLIPPTRILSMLHTWRNTPRIVAALARAQRPRARVVVLGHTHYPGVWRVPGSPDITVINTGSFSRPFGGLAVDVEGSSIQVVRVTRKGGEFRTSGIVADITLAD
jgi:predicted phosphodiesterase